MDISDCAILSYEPVFAVVNAQKSPEDGLSGKSAAFGASRGLKYAFGTQKPKNYTISGNLYAVAERYSCPAPYMGDLTHGMFTASGNVWVSRQKP